MTLCKCQCIQCRAIIGDTLLRRGEGKTEVKGEKRLGARARTNNKLNPHMTPSPGIEPGSHW